MFENVHSTWEKRKILQCSNKEWRQPNIEKTSNDARINITTQSVASPRTPPLSMITIVTFTFELWPPKSIGFTMVNMSAKFDEEAHNGLVSIRFTVYFFICPLWPWPLTSKINRVHPLTKVNISAKFDDKEIQNGLVSIVFTSLSPYMSIVTLTFDLQNQ